MRLILLLAVTVLSPIISVANDFALGDKVFFKSGADAKNDDDVVIDTELIREPAIVEDQQGHLVWLGRGWVRASDLIKASNASNYFTDLIRQSPEKSSLRRRRSIVFSENRQLPEAIEDCHEAIRLDPQDARNYIARGSVWSLMHELD